jgi:hypothetical protein
VYFNTTVRLQYGQCLNRSSIPFGVPHGLRYTNNGGGLNANGRLEGSIEEKGVYKFIVISYMECPINRYPNDGGVINTQYTCFTINVV